MKLKVYAYLFCVLGLTPFYSINAEELGVGLGVVYSGPVYIGTSDDIAPAPIIYFRSEKIEAGLGEFSYLVSDYDNFQFRLEASARFEGYDSDDSDELSGMEEREAGLDAGFSLITGDLWGELELKLLTDISGKSDGFETSVMYQFPIQKSLWLIVPNIGLLASNGKLVDYYFGVNQSEELPTRNAYQGESTIDVFAGVTVLYKLTQTSDLMFTSSYLHFGKEKRDSPIVDRDSNASLLAAYVYKF